MKMWKQKTWQHEITGIDGNTILFGVNIFDYQWKTTGQRVKVRDPQFGENRFKAGTYMDKMLIFH